ncbi:hypothetical protein Ocepr_2256 (plasmid) [Oceanithermus profundus DSM 14977]|uniref:Uncharacterized protein n=1 Tax=Oceanithermus profundus (strain DSM 14977 / NBRC 100410 / VKM B-2274 / 506) TaxID=670487 RepID=E4UAR9_OCEP5|nr:hypothetical protein [Oceanithermus profundus]ADR37704.1 hypothetical protein Ocepr_2256 [Oceanithermus profundus DSM 14977]
MMTTPPAPLRVFYEGLTAFSDTFALYPTAYEQTKFGIALLSLSGPREAVRAVQSALFIPGGSIHALTDKGEIFKLAFLGTEHWQTDKAYGLSIVHRQGTAQHVLMTSKEFSEGHVAFGRSKDEHERALHRAISDHLPFPTHPLWSEWWVETLLELDYLTPLPTSPGFYATAVESEEIQRNRKGLFDLLTNALRSGELETPRPAHAQEAA